MSITASMSWKHYHRMSLNTIYAVMNICNATQINNLSLASTHPTCLQKLFSSTVATGNPCRLLSKVMMTMTHLMADDDPPRYRNNLIGIATPSQPLQESIASKDGTHGLDSPRYHHLTNLQEILPGFHPLPHLPLSSMAMMTTLFDKCTRPILTSYLHRTIPTSFPFSHNPPLMIM